MKTKRTKKEENVKQKKNNIKNFFQRDKLPITIGIIGFLLCLVFVLLYFGLGMFGKIPGVFVATEGEVNCTELENYDLCRYYGNYCTWIGNKDSGECKPKSETSCRDIREGAHCIIENKDRCIWSYSAGQCFSPSEISCEQIKHSDSCRREDVSCAWYGDNGRDGECRPLNCEELTTYGSCTNFYHACTWVGSDWETGECKSSSEINCGDIFHAQDCGSKASCSWVGDWYTGECKDNSELSCEDINADSCNMHDDCSWVGGSEGGCKPNDEVSCEEIVYESSCQSSNVGCLWLEQDGDYDTGVCRTKSEVSCGEIDDSRVCMNDVNTCVWTGEWWNGEGQCEPKNGVNCYAINQHQFCQSVNHCLWNENYGSYGGCIPKSQLSCRGIEDYHVCNFEVKGCTWTTDNPYDGECTYIPIFSMSPDVRQINVGDSIDLNLATNYYSDWRVDGFGYVMVDDNNERGNNQWSLIGTACAGGSYPEPYDCTRTFSPTQAGRYEIVANAKDYQGNYMSNNRMAPPSERFSDDYIFIDVIDNDSSSPVKHGDSCSSSGAFSEDGCLRCYEDGIWKLNFSKYTAGDAGWCGCCEEYQSDLMSVYGKDCSTIDPTAYAQCSGSTSPVKHGNSCNAPNTFSEDGCLRCYEDGIWKLNFSKYTAGDGGWCGCCDEYSQDLMSVYGKDCSTIDPTAYAQCSGSSTNNACTDGCAKCDSDGNILGLDFGTEDDYYDPAGRSWGEHWSYCNSTYGN